MNRWQRECHERVMDVMTRRIREQRTINPGSSMHVAAVRTKGGVHQLEIPRETPDIEVRASLEAQLAIINAKERG